MNQPSPQQPAPASAGKANGTATDPRPMGRRWGTLRQRILFFVGALVLLSLAGSTFSLYRITEVNRALNAINRVSVPLGRLLAQLNADAEVYRREADRRLGLAGWNDARWSPKPVPRWIEEVIENELTRSSELVEQELPWAPPAARAEWRHWMHGLRASFAELQALTRRTQRLLEAGDRGAAAELYPELSRRLDEWARQVSWGVTEYDRTLKHAFAGTQAQVGSLRTGLELILITVIALSGLLLWLGERALRPLGELTRLAREITRRGLRREDKVGLPAASLLRDDEVGALGREFHRMATALLERENLVETQKSRLEESNRRLREMGALNENILSSIPSVLVVTDLAGRITQCNPPAARFLDAGVETVLGTDITLWPRLARIAGVGEWLPRLPTLPDAVRIDPATVDGRVYGGHWMALRADDGRVRGAILSLDDLTEELDLQDRLRRAENLAAVGRMSAQVAHEVRNPLHAIGLEAELALEIAARHPQPQLRQSLQSIQAAVDRLEKITENYLRLSRLSAGRRETLDLGDVLESVLATYAPACQAQGVRVEWSRAPGAALRVFGDRDLLEQALGNLLRNALQALDGESVGADGEPVAVAAPSVTFRLGARAASVGAPAAVWIEIEDNGPGLAPSVRERLFTPFVTTRAQGTGLGLSFVQRVVNEHGGRVDCPVRARGACFRVELPAAEVSARADDAGLDPVRSPAPPAFELPEVPHDA